MATYQVRHAGQVVETHRSESKAIEAAKRIEEATVVMVEASGSYSSRTQVWPTVGATYSN